MSTQLNICLIRCYSSRHSSCHGEACECCSGNQKRCGIRYKWVTWDDFVGIYHLFKYQYDLGVSTAAYSSRTAFPKPEDAHRRVSGYVYRLILHGQVLSEAEAESFDGTDRRLLQLGWFPYDLDKERVSQAWQDDHGCRATVGRTGDYFA